MTDDRARAGRYARAVLEAMVERWQGALSTVADDPKLVSLLNDDSKGADAKNKAVAEALPADTPAEIHNLISLLIQEGDIDLIPEVSAALSSAASGRQAPIKAEVTSAAELSEDEREKLRQSLTAQYGDGLVFSFEVNPELLGGLRVRVGDRLIDNSVASRLAKLRESIASVVR